MGFTALCLLEGETLDSVVVKDIEKNFSNNFFCACSVVSIIKVGDDFNAGYFDAVADNYDSLYFYEDSRDEYRELITAIRNKEVDGVVALLQCY